jgi:hypothetical protein
MEDDDRSGAHISRRGMLSGMGAALVGSSLVGGEAEAAVAGNHHDGAVPFDAGRARGASSPITTTIASPPTSAYIYKIVDMYEFKPFNPAAGLTWGGNGTYAGGTGTTIRASIDIPPGCLIREIEYYIYNNSGSNFSPDSHIYVPGQGAIASIGALVAIPSSTSIQAARAIVTQQGPYPFGAKLMISCSTPSTGVIQVNGARVGFTGAAAGVGTRGTPQRVFNGAIGAGATKTITLPDTLIAPGVMGILADVTVSGSNGNGALTVFRADTGQPAQPNMRYGTAPTTSEATVQVSAARQIKVHTSRAVDVAIDVIGILG